MPNLAAVLRSEIARLARRSISPLYRSLKHDVAALKRALAQQKRLVTQLQRDNARLIADLNTRIAAPPMASDDEVKRARLSPRIIRSQRARLGLSRHAFAKLVGVSGTAVLAWEGGTSKPRAAAKAAIVAVRKLGKREAQRRLQVLATGSNGTAANGGKAAARVSRKGSRQAVRPRKH